MLRELPGFYGKTLKTRSMGDFVMSERAYPPGYETPAHTHDRPLFCVVLDGSYEEVNSGRSHVCTSSTMLFHAAHEEHLERFGVAGGRSLIVEIEPSWYHRVREVAPGGVATAACEGGSLRHSGTRLYREFLAVDDSSCLIIEGLMLEMAGEFLRLRQPSEIRPPRWLSGVCDYIHANFARRLTLESIGRAANAHPVHVAQTFRRFHQCTIGDYLRRLRLDYACRRLAESETPICEIALEAGFTDQSHFHRSFKREMGISPSEYRKATLGQASAAAELARRSRPLP
ncbi:MAG TPA: AraC family transcriptional regulator [Candidatus Acidoferrales bacterium]|nr:AraC family transcriptional regulator [Candidatus Acidoferrales bacterium]